MTAAWNTRAGLPWLVITVPCLLAIFVCLRPNGLAADEPTVVPLWPAGAPGAVGDAESDRPTLTIHLAPGAAEHAPGVVVCPGGGYGGLALVHEGQDIAAWFNSLGVSAFVLRYRHAPHYRHPTPLGDAQRAVRLARSQAGPWRLDSQRLGIIGFSAGGHLASSVGTHFDAGVPDATDTVDRQSCRPDWMILLYPVISLVEECTHAGSRRNLLGETPAPELLQLMSNEKQVTPQTPPTLLVHTGEDTAVPVENSLLFYGACRQAGVPAALYVFERGRHGLGLGTDDPEFSRWPVLAANWLRQHGFLPAETSK